MKYLITNSDALAIELVKVVTDPIDVACVYYAWAHLFEECSTNLVSVNYEGIQKYNNPYTNTYNPW